MSDVEKAIIKTLFEKAYAMRPVGSKDKAWASLAFHARRKDKDEKPIGEQFILDKYMQYLNMCKKEQKDQKYIKYLEHFIEDGLYWGDYTFTDKHTSTVDRWLSGILKAFSFLQ